MSDILITGSHGLIGTHLRHRLKSQNISFVGLDNRLDPSDPDYGELLQPDTFRNKVNQCRGIIHLGGCSRVILGETDPTNCWNVNVQATAHLIDMAVQSPRKPWVLYASSREVYGQQKTFPVVEDAPLDPMNIYAHSKVAAENQIIDARNQGLHTSIVRFSNVFGGPFDYPDRVIPAFCRAALLGETLALEGSDHVFDFTYIGDVVSGLFKALSVHLSSPTDLPTIHFTTGRGLRLRDAAQIILHLAKSASRLEEKAPRNYDVRYFYGDPTRAKKYLGWTPEYTFEQAIKVFLFHLQEVLQKESPSMESYIA